MRSVGHPDLNDRALALHMESPGFNPWNFQEWLENVAYLEDPRGPLSVSIGNFELHRVMVSLQRSQHLSFPHKDALTTTTTSLREN